MAVQDERKRRYLALNCPIEDCSVRQDEEDAVKDEEEAAAEAEEEE